MSKKLTKNALTATATTLAMAASITSWAIEPQYIKLTESTLFIPTLQLKEVYDDNFHADDNNEQSSWITTLAPSFTLAGKGNKSGYLINYTASSDTFHSSQKDNNTDHIFTAESNLEFNARNRLKLNAGYRDIEETATLNQNQENDQYNSKTIGGVYTYGARTARAQIDLGANYDELRYSNSNHLNDDEERDTTALRSTFYYRVAPDTRLLLEARHTDYDYISDTNSSSTNIDLLTGVTWDATAKTSGSIKVGRGQKDYDNSGIDTASTGMWEVGATWKPRTYSTFRLTTRRAFDEGSNSVGTIGDGTDTTVRNTNDDSAVKLQTTTLGWKHYWIEHLYSDLSYTRMDLEYLDSNREDKLNNIGLGLTYEMRRWLDIGLGYKYSENDSDVNSESYERNIYALTINASL
ncbi:outer membrane beta-barrel protein [Pseudomonas sp. MAP12]|uniref:Outer membrane beta-barrel protein n=1 Tax=Geopseudomonas aromaticivorans TaxID=2849492 RepID=A0ABS6MVX3_9GAMM|nr:outer membrane beta-barrel protein [Pseudomonas aromaticivorans]MBV2132958.1 outer membrane beta-barrel protein [Pseudomonas aromaticivorans]